MNCNCIFKAFIPVANQSSYTPMKECSFLFEPSTLIQSGHFRRGWSGNIEDTKCMFDIRFCFHHKAFILFLVFKYLHKKSENWKCYFHFFLCKSLKTRNMLKARWHLLSKRKQYFLFLFQIKETVTFFYFLHSCTTASPNTQF